MTFLWITLGVIAAGVVLALLRSASQPPAPLNVSDADIRSEARKGNHVVAIRWYRGLHLVGLKRAREAVQKLDCDEKPSKEQ
jgi:ribosomal protein L7/L12